MTDLIEKHQALNNLRYKHLYNTECGLFATKQINDFYF